MIAAAVAVEAEALHHKRKYGTLSHLTRTVFRTQYKPGKILFVLSWAWLTYWFLPHILRDVLEEVLEDAKATLDI